MLNGMCQCLNTGIVPGNRNADNIDPALRKFEHIVSNLLCSQCCVIYLTNEGI
jgi:3-oxoacyl-(acyl-carrier-protein) synthase